MGNPREFSILEFAQKTISLTGSDSKMVFKTLPSDDPKQRQPDIPLARRALGWEPTTPFEEGLKRTISYFREPVGYLPIPRGLRQAFENKPNLKRGKQKWFNIF